MPAAYAAGMLVGPPVSSLVYARFGGGAMLGQLAALWCAFVAFTIVFWKDDPAARRVPAPPASADYEAVRTDIAAP
jgi:hypothetical protein